MSLDRKSEFKKDVKLSTTAPDRIKAELSKDVVKSSEAADFTLTVSVAKDAPLGKHVIKVAGTPDSGAATSVDVNIEVEKNP